MDRGKVSVDEQMEEGSTGLGIKKFLYHLATMIGYPAPLSTHAYAKHPVR